MRLQLEDERSSSVGIRLTGAQTLTGNAQTARSIYLFPEPNARIYRLVGMGMKQGKSTLKLGTVFKAWIDIPSGHRCMHLSRGSTMFAKQPTLRRETQTKNLMVENPLCYICWSDKPPPGAPGSGEGENADEVNPLIVNPCGKCSGGSRYVHLHCILKWIKSSRSGQCSVCMGSLPPAFTTPPEYLQLKVIRHRRGARWNGTRRFHLSFSDTARRTLGSGSGSDVTLRDRSVSEYTQKLFSTQSENDSRYAISTTTGTFVLLDRPLEMSLNGPVCFVKVGKLSHFFQGAKEARVK